MMGVKEIVIGLLEIDALRMGDTDSQLNLFN